jgi:hypothetical protein
MPSPVTSVPALSLQPAFRRSHGSLYKALARGEVDAGYDPIAHPPSRVPSAVPAATATGSAAPTGRPGRHPMSNCTPKTTATAPCMPKPATVCIPR